MHPRRCGGGHSSFQEPWVFLREGGRRGAQAETLSSGGVYNINPWFAHVVPIPTRILTLDWTNKEHKPPNNFDGTLDQISINIEGYCIRFEMNQTIEIPAAAAPKLVSRFGEAEDQSGTDPSTAPVQRFVTRVLGSTVESYFNDIANRYEVHAFLTDYHAIQRALGNQVRQALAEWGVIALHTTLGDYELQQTSLDEERRARAVARAQRQVLLERLDNVDIERQIGLKELELERERVLLNKAELEREIELLGRDSVTKQRFVDALVKMGVPHTIIGDARSLVDQAPLPAMMALKEVGLDMVGVLGAAAASQPGRPAEVLPRTPRALAPSDPLENDVHEVGEVIQPPPVRPSGVHGPQIKSSAPRANSAFATPPPIAPPPLKPPPQSKSTPPAAPEQTPHIEPPKSVPPLRRPNTARLGDIRPSNGRPSNGRPSNGRPGNGPPSHTAQSPAPHTAAPSEPRNQTEFDRESPDELPPPRPLSRLTGSGRTEAKKTSRGMSDKRDSQEPEPD